MPETHRKFDPEFREGAVRIVRETTKSISQVARDLGINAGTLGNWVAHERAGRDGTQGLSTDDVTSNRRAPRSPCATPRHGRPAWPASHPRPLPTDGSNPRYR